MYVDIFTIVNWTDQIDLSLKPLLYKDTFIVQFRNASQKPCVPRDTAIGSPSQV